MNFKDKDLDKELRTIQLEDELRRIRRTRVEFDEFMLLAHELIKTLGAGSYIERATPETSKT